MPVLPLIDLLILLAWTSLIVAFVQKAIGLALALEATVMGMSPFDFVLVAAVALLFALALAARVWVRANEPRFLRERARARRVLPDGPDPRERAAEPPVGEAPAPSPPAPAASAEGAARTGPVDGAAAR